MERADMFGKEFMTKIMSAEILAKRKHKDKTHSFQNGGAHLVNHQFHAHASFITFSSVCMKYKVCPSKEYHLCLKKLRKLNVSL